MHSAGISWVTLLRIACRSQSDERSRAVEAAWVWPLCCLARCGTSATSGSSWKAECLLQGSVCMRVCASSRFPVSQQRGNGCF